MARKRVLFVLHNHPKLLVGGVEMYVADVHRALAASDEYEPLMLARAGRPYTSYDAPHADTPLSLVGPDPDQYLLFTDFEDFDYFEGSLRTKEVLTGAYRDFLLNTRPDVVHFQHTIFLGYDIVRVTRNTLPDVPIVYSLHEYMPICHRDGVMVRTRNAELCEEESPRRCHECFPEVSPQAFYMRKRFIQSHLALVDTFIAPSEYVKERYVQWGLDPARIVVEPQGFVAEGAAPADEPARPSRDRFAYFGQLNPYKGADVLLRAIDILGPEADAHLTVFGANLDKQSPRWQEQFGELLAIERPNVSFVGGYDRAELGKLMAEVDWVVVPSVWWETGPLVVWEAFQYRRPVICSDIGGMSEKVADGVNGLHFRRGDAVDLAAAMQRAMETPGLWDTLRKGIPPRPGHPLDRHVATLTGIYSALLHERPAVAAEIPLEVAGG